MLDQTLLNNTVVILCYFGESQKTITNYSRVFRENGTEDNVVPKLEQ